MATSLSLAALVAWSGAAGSAAAASAVPGLIVRLKDASPHARILSQSQGRTAEAEARRQALAQDAARWHRVINSAGLTQRAARLAPRRQAVGRDQQVLSFGRQLTHAEALALRQRLLAQPEVEWVELDLRERRVALPDDPFLQPFGPNEGQWWLGQVRGAAGSALVDRRRGVPGFQAAWQLPGGTGSGRVAPVVAVLDTGITSHPELSGRLLPGFDFIGLEDDVGAAYANDGDGRDSDPADPGDWVDATDQLRNPAAFRSCEMQDSSWHGTVIAGLLAAATDNSHAVAAIQWAGRVLPVRVAGKCGARVSDIVDGMRWAAGLPVAGVPDNPHPARVINVSFGGSNPCGPAYQATVDELRALGVVVVAAAGNEHAAPTRPANCSGVVGVVGLNRDGFKTHYSNFGAALSSSGIATVSGDDRGDVSARWNALADSGILTVANEGRQGPGLATYASHFGTSFAAPMVSGTLALMLGVNPALSHVQLMDGLRLGARPHVTSSQIGLCSDSNPGRCLCTTATCGVGILDAEQAVLYAASASAYVAGARSSAQVDHPDIAVLAASGQDRPANISGPLMGGGTPPAIAGGDSGGGGGAASLPWLLGLLSASGLLAQVQRRSSRRRSPPR